MALTNKDLEKIDKLFEKRVENLATKDELKNLTSKDELISLASAKDVELLSAKVATKVELGIIENDVKSIKADVEIIRDDITNIEDKVDTLTEKVNPAADRINLLMTKDEAIHLFEVATMKTQLNHLRKLAREKWGVEV